MYFRKRQHPHSPKLVAKDYSAVVVLQVRKAEIPFRLISQNINYRSRIRTRFIYMGQRCLLLNFLFSSANVAVDDTSFRKPKVVTGAL